MPSSPSAAASAALSGAGVRRKSGRPEKKARGCGSKVSMMQGTLQVLGLRARRRQHRLVAAVHAVEIADRHDAALPGFGKRRRGVATLVQCLSGGHARSARPAERGNVGDALRGPPP